jgi:rhamnosyl/mannosyltransferase
MHSTTTTGPAAAEPFLHLVTGPAEQPRLTVVIPTFNESGNVAELLRRLADALPAEFDAEVIFVDDSTDDTPSVIATAAERSPLDVRLIHRDRPEGGLGGAVVAGLQAARAPWAVVMDGDLQHPASVVPQLFDRAMTGDADVVVATRYADGGSEAGLANGYRRAVSTQAKKVAGLLLGGAVREMTDPLSGFFAVRIAALRLAEVEPMGYKILLELVVRSGLRRIAEVPFTFEPRHAGESKSTLREGLRFVRHLASLRRVRPVTPDLETTTGLRVLVVTSEAAPIVSGISRTVERIASGLRERGHSVDVLSSVQIPRLVLGEYRFSALAAWWPSISRRLRDYDVVQLHGPVPTMSDVFLTLGAGRRAPIVYVHHCPLAIRGKERLCELFNRIHRRLSRRAEMIVATSEYYASTERQVDGPEVRVAPLGVDVRPQPLKIAGGPLRVLFVGQMRGYKGVDQLIRAAAGQPELEVTLVGDGPERGAFEQLAADLDAQNVNFVGRLSDEALHAEFDRNQVVVLPSVTQAEAFGLVTLEGMAAGCVPVVSDLPGVRDLAEGVGTIVPPKDAVALRAALLELAADPAHLRKLGHLARRKAEGLSWDNCVDLHERALLDAAVRAGTATLPVLARLRRTAAPVAAAVAA